MHTHQAKSSKSQAIPDRIRRELVTVKHMIHIYCISHNHTTSGLCEDCKELMLYSENRLKKCHFQENKPTCGRCPIHCYKPAMQKKIIKIMNFSGPRMVTRHPFLALAHLFDSHRPVKKLTVSAENCINKKEK